MAFKIWQIGLHLQQQEAVAVAIVRGAKECFLQRWWRLPLENDIIKDGRIVDAQQLAKTLLPWSRELPQRHHIMLAFPASRTLQRSFPRPSMSLGEREQTAWLSGTMARELDMDPDSLRFDYSEDSLSPAYNVTAAQSKELATLPMLDSFLQRMIAFIDPPMCAQPGGLRRATPIHRSVLTRLCCAKSFAPCRGYGGSGPHGDGCFAASEHVPSAPAQRSPGRAWPPFAPVDKRLSSSRHAHTPARARARC